MQSELKKAFIETGTLVLGGMVGAGISYVLFGAHWAPQAIFAVAGACLASVLAHRRQERQNR